MPSTRGHCWSKRWMAGNGVGEESPAPWSATGATVRATSSRIATRQGLERESGGATVAEGAVSTISEDGAVEKAAASTGAGAAAALAASTEDEAVVEVAISTGEEAAAEAGASADAGVAEK